MMCAGKTAGVRISAWTALFLIMGISMGWADELSKQTPGNNSLDVLPLPKALDDSDLNVQGQGLEVNIGDIGLNAAENSAVVTGNQVSGNVNTGQIGSNTFSNVSGINSVMFNTGNNVSFQSNMQVNVILK